MSSSVREVPRPCQGVEPAKAIVSTACISTLPEKDSRFHLGRYSGVCLIAQSQEWDRGIPAMRLGRMRAFDGELPVTSDGERAGRKHGDIFSSGNSFSKGLFRVVIRGHVGHAAHSSEETSDQPPG